MFKLILVSVVLSSFVLKADNPQAKIIKFKDFEAIEKQAKNDGSDTIYVINFFATWCKPCVKELSGFQKLSLAHKKDRVKVIFISLDFKTDFEEKLIPFINSHNITEPVYLLDEVDYNKWIDKVDNSWGGSIPATLVINHQNKFHQFYETELTIDLLEGIVKPLLKK